MSVEDIVVKLTRSQYVEAHDLIKTHVAALEKSGYFKEAAFKRNTTELKCKDDTILGKKGEVFVQRLLLNAGTEAKIDWDIYDTWDKSWDADIMFGNPPTQAMHVKTCNAFTLEFCDDFSWTFGKKNTTNNHGRDKILDGTNDYCAFVYTENSFSASGVIKAILRGNDFIPHLDDPKKSELKDLKSCLYYKKLNPNQ